MPQCNFKLIPENNAYLANLCGSLDENLKKVEHYLDVKINTRGFNFQINGANESIAVASYVIQELYGAAQTQTPLPSEYINWILKNAVSGSEEVKSKKTLFKRIEPSTKDYVIKTPRLKIKPHTLNQKSYVKNILSHSINFGVGPAGSGKTFLAVACALADYEKKLVERIYLVRPAVEAGERLGFLPGDFSQKLDPYFKPLYDALQEILGTETTKRLIEDQTIEVAPLAFMRGRTLNEGFIILDEGQNTTREQMKMFLTRLGYNSKVVITGDITQTDLPRGVQSGLEHALKILQTVDGISFNYFDSNDILRHPLVKSILKAYET